MSDASEDDRAVRLVRLGYGLGDGDDPNADRALTFRVAAATHGGAIACAQEVGRYNGYDGDAVGEAMREIAHRYDPYRIEVGREGSPVIYVRGLDDDEIKPASEILAAVGADELDATSDGTLRAWWD